ncbi:MAG: hypothetical protein HY814_14660 [Candidatus Riflebacteria bacterium]|nr:hypothetical protein [Candidatus Riflebacteria bacterium]
MEILRRLRSFLGFSEPCPRCREPLVIRPVFTVPTDERLTLITGLLKLGRVKDDALRGELEGLMARRLELPRNVATGLRATLEHCPACKFGALQMTLLKDGQPVETKRHDATGAGYVQLSQFLGGR